MINQSDSDAVAAVVVIVVASVHKCRFMVFDFDMVEHNV